MLALVKDYFAGYKEAEFKKALKQSIGKNEALLAVQDGLAAGLLLFSHSDKEIMFLAVHPFFRKKNIAKQLILQMVNHFSEEDIIHVITFRGGDPKGIAARAFYQSCGFKDDKKVIVFDYPCQVMTSGPACIKKKLQKKLMIEELKKIEENIPLTLPLCHTLYYY